MRKSAVALCLVLLAVVVVSVMVHAQKDDAVATITKIENDAVKADLANDASFYQKYLADDWTGGTSFGEWETKSSVMQGFSDPSNNKTNSETMSDLKVRTYGDVAVATYKETYDSIVRGEHRSRTVIATDVFQKQDGTWKQIAGHASQAK